MPTEPWIDEPDSVDGAFGDIPWVLRRGPTGLGHWCGYVAIAPGHPWHGRHYADIPVEVHWGLTWDGDGRPDFPDLPGWWWVGFDCAHAGDLVPGMVDLLPPGLVEGDTYRTVDYARAEVETLAAQVGLAVSIGQVGDAGGQDEVRRDA